MAKNTILILALALALACVVLGNPVQLQEQGAKTMDQANFRPERQAGYTYPNPQPPQGYYEKFPVNQEVIDWPGILFTTPVYNYQNIQKESQQIFFMRKRYL